MERISKIDTSKPKLAKYRALFNYLEAKIGLELLNRKK
jgi:hypothetical protein